MPSTSRRQPTLELTELDTPKNIEHLGSVMTSEAGGVNETAQAAVGWTVINRMKKDKLTNVSDVWDPYAHRHFSNGMSRQLAGHILDGTAKDISDGATHFYTPNIMPKAGEPPSGFDVGGGLETVAGVTKNNKPVQNYRPGWAQRYHPVYVSGILEKDFKFYKQ